MDINKILPLLINKSGMQDERTQALMKLASGEKPDIGTVMNMAVNGRKKPRPSGLKAVSDFIPCEILGKLVKYFL